MVRQLHRYFCFAMLLVVFPLLAGAATQVADLKRIENPNPANDAAFGGSVAGVGDLNGDGIGDLVIGAPGSDKVYVISGKDQSVMAQFELAPWCSSLPQAETAVLSW